jgi:hypothetical protein
MKKLIEDVEDKGLVSLLGKRITLFALNYIYTGKLAGVNDNCVKLENAAVVYETGPYNEKSWKNAQYLPNDWYVQLSAVESFGVLKE